MNEPGSASVEFYQLSRQYMDAVLKHERPPPGLIKKAKNLVLESGANPGYVHTDDSSPINTINFNKTSFKGLIGRTALMNYAVAGCVDMVEFILLQGGEFSINARDWQRVDYLSMFSMLPYEKKIAKDIKISERGTFTSALSAAVTSGQHKNDRIVKILLDHGADPAIFADEQYYRPMLFVPVGDLSNDNSHIRVRTEHRARVELLVKAMEVNSQHLTTYKRTHHVLTKMLNGWKYTHHQNMPMPGRDERPNIFRR